ncbi:E2 [Capreolus capreolus papillomavirus 1]|uniref:Regulatory protein E2 n=1 Tax=Capreolus capreolus papillomavirus 1 TaxID=470214 RepID=B3ST93_9PAPI|nr:E2 [Capreolus capreolus papillomavirus 1]ABV27563.1 E2 [Capreolus capreolus papillomavirus 1]QNR09264.1 E2 [Capreolus capreolus papillomavirus 1]QNR09272.1 E2 [Capreolus capreolus papillomavirus 1]QNR09280.1 E2 [Capreolus capreolus papillomavirus 1]QNR09288.1 E2 [Capreolus capreolus papillomavirus 1]
MSAASERLLAAQEQQMELIEKNSQCLADHVIFWETVRSEQVLLYAARKKGLTMLGMCPVPACSVSAEKAKQAIEMQLLLTEMLETPWGQLPWSLCDTSWDRYVQEPKKCLKQGARIIEVEYDGNSSNKTWYTAWSALYMRTSTGWELYTGSADGLGLYFASMNGARTYYEFFSKDATRYGTTGTWIVRDGHNVFHSPSGPSPHLRHNLEGLWQHNYDPVSRGTDAPDRAVFDSSPRHSPFHGPFRAGQDRNRTAGRPSPYSSHSSGSAAGSNSSPALPSAVPLGDQRGEEGDSPPSPDSTEVTSQAAAAAAVTFNLFGTEGAHQCLLVTGNGNQVKCYRFRIKKNHRHRYRDCTTTWWTVGDEGSERQGNATVLITFISPDQRRDFLKAVPLPPGMVARGLTVTPDF